MTETVNVRKVIEIDVKASKDAADAVKKMAAEMGTLEGHAKKASGGISQMLGILRAGVHLFWFSELAMIVKDVVLYINDLNDKASITIKRMEQITGSNAMAKQSFQDIVDVSIRQGQAFDGVAKLYEKAMRNADAWGITMDGAKQITDGFSASLRLSGASTQESYAALVQFGQVLASGKFQGDEFRSMMENNATFMYELAKATGSTVAELRKLGTEGKLGPEFLRDAMFRLGDDGMNMLERLAKKAGELPMTFRQAMEGVKTALVDLVEAMQGASEKTEGWLTRIARSFADWISEGATRKRLMTQIEERIKELTGETKKTEVRPPNQVNYEFLANQKSDAERILEDTKKRLANLKSIGASEDSFAFKEAMQDMARVEARIKATDEALTDLFNKMYPATPRTPLIPDWKPTTKPGDDKKKPASTVDPLNALKDKLVDVQGEYDRMMTSQLETRLTKFNEWLAKKPELLKVPGSTALIDQIRVMVEAMDTADGAAAAAAAGIENMKNEEKLALENAKELDKVLAKIAKDNPITKIQAQIDEIDNALTMTQDVDMIAQLLAGRAQLVGDLWKATKRGVGEAADEAESAAKRIEKAFDKAAGNMTDALVDFAFGTKSSFGDMVISILSDFAKVEARTALSPIFKMFFRGVSGAIGDWLFPEVPTTGTFARMDRLTTPPPYVGQYEGFADGGVIDSPTFFRHAGGRAVAGEAGTEVIAPLRRGEDGKMGVGAVAPIVQIINNTRAATVRAEETQSEDGTKTLQVFVEDAVETAFGTGRFDRTLSTLYGVGRKAR